MLEVKKGVTLLKGLLSQRGEAMGRGGNRMVAHLRISMGEKGRGGSRGEVLHLQGGMFCWSLNFN